MVMRFDIYKVRSYLVHELMAARGVVDLMDDGTDLVIVQLRSGDRVLIQLIDRLVPPSELIEMLNQNSSRGLYTLLILWADMLLPPEGEVYLADDWMEALYTLYGDRIYGYDAYGAYASVFPVYFRQRAGTLLRDIVHGGAVDVDRLTVDHVHISGRDMNGYGRVAGFAPWTQGQEAPSAEAPFVAGGSMAVYYAVFDLRPDADREAVRQAYRRMARAHHPDVNDSPDATRQMQHINDAYRHIMKHLGDDV